MVVRLTVPAQGHILKNPDCVCGEAPCRARLKLQQLKDDASLLESQIKSLKKYLKTHKSKHYSFALWLLKHKSAKYAAKIENQRAFMKKKGWPSFEIIQNSTIIYDKVLKNN